MHKYTYSDINIFISVDENKQVCIHVNFNSPNSYDW